MTSESMYETGNDGITNPLLENPENIQDEICTPGARNVRK